jgi:hypothetical protein
MKHLLLCLTFLVGIINFSFSQNFGNFNDWPYETKRAFKEKAKSVIDQIFPQIQKAESWSWDIYEYGSITIENVKYVGENDHEVTLKVTGGFLFTRKGWRTTKNKRGTYSAIAKVTKMGTVYMKEVCNTLDGGCHDTEDWASSN